MALVNAVTTRSGDASDAALGEVLSRYNYLVEELTADGARQLRRWAAQLRPVFITSDQTEVIDLLNTLMIQVPMQPHLADHGRGPHLHYAASGTGLINRVRANTVIGLASLICASGTDRRGACAAAGCDRVYADTSRGTRRKFCSTACLNRSTVAAFRARKAAGKI